MGEQSLATTQKPSPKKQAQIILALSYAKLDRVDEARTLLDKSRKAIETEFAGNLRVGTEDTGNWSNWLIARILLREADELLASRARGKN